MSSSKVSVMIPAYNAAELIGQTLDSVLANEVALEIIVVDDGSSDNTVEIVRAYGEKHPCITVLSSDANGGAGLARNRAMAQATGDYFYFIDADDMLAPAALDEVVLLLDETGCDVVTFKHQYLVDEKGNTKGMHKQDKDAWDSIVGEQPAAFVDLQRHGQLLGTINYPWNKVMRADFCRAINLRFSTTAVHNDMLAFWLIYLNARNIVMYNKCLITYREIRGREQLTNVFTERRLEIFRAFEEIEALFAADATRKRLFYPWFLFLKMDLLKWVSRSLDKTLMDRFHELVSASYIRHLSDQAYYDAHRVNPHVARFSLTMKYAPEKMSMFKT